VLFTEANLQWLAAHVGLGGFGRAHFSLIDQMWASQRPALQRRLDEENQRGAEGRMREDEGCVLAATSSQTPPSEKTHASLSSDACCSV
jgi:hypothetical protein